MNRETLIEALHSGPLDVLVIGGGVNGAGILRDLALRARSTGTDLKLALVERAHFSSGTSGRNSQLIHGGLRYLKNMEFGLVSEALAERAILLRTAPHLVTPLPFLIPMRDWFSTVFYEAGLVLYDTLAGSHRIERFRHLSAREMHTIEPRLTPVTAGARFFDCGVHSARLVLLNIREAVANGAMAANYVSVEVLEKTEAGLWRIELMDRLSGTRFTVESKSIVDATGAWSQETKLRLVRGSHLVFPRLGETENAIANFQPDGRVIFFIPWGRRHAFTLVGTTDVDHAGSPDSVRISEEEIQYLRNAVAEVFPACAAEEPVCAYSSLRPLVKDESTSATKTSREHRIWADVRGMVHVSGGKYTTYRLMSEEASDLLCAANFPEIAQTHVTAATPILGNSPGVVQVLLRDVAMIAAEQDLDAEDVADIVHHYGIETPELLRGLPDQAPDGLTRLESAQICFAVEKESVECLSDLLFISTYWGYEKNWTRELLQPFARELGRHAGWNEPEIACQIDQMLALVDNPAA